MFAALLCCYWFVVDVLMFVFVCVLRLYSVVLYRVLNVCLFCCIIVVVLVLASCCLIVFACCGCISFV